MCNQTYTCRSLRKDVDVNLDVDALIGFFLQRDLLLLCWKKILLSFFYVIVF